MTSPPRRTNLGVLLAASWLVACWVFRDTYFSILALWHDNSTFSHGWLIVPLSVWLAWRRRDELARAPFVPSWPGVLLVVGCLLLWIAARGSGVAGAGQFAAVALLPALFLAVLGWEATKAWAFPLGFLLFGVPIGHALVPGLMQFTADVATWALRVTGVPVARSYMHISIPEGDFEVAKACSGLNYLVTGFVLGVLYSYLTYRGWKKRLLGVLAFIIVPVFANGLRVYFTILASHFTNMTFGPGEEHVWFGRVFFIVVMVAMFAVGRRWHDDDQPAAPVTSAIARDAPGPAGWLAVATVFALLVATPVYLRATQAAIEARLTVESSRLQLPAAGSGWQGPALDGAPWRPLYQGARVERLGSYTDAAGTRVDVFVGVYGVGVSDGTEMISFDNRILEAEHVSLALERLRRVPLPDGGSLTVREQVVSDRSGSHRVWHWFLVGDRVVHDRYVVKGLEAISFITRGAVTERIVTLSAPASDAGERALQAFVATHAACVRAGFAFEACGR